MKYESTSLASKEYFQQRSITSSIYGETTASSSTENVLPSSPDFVLVEYPGVVKNVDKALQTLGGISAVATVIFVLLRVTDNLNLNFFLII